MKLAKIGGCALLTLSSVACSAEVADGAVDGESFGATENIAETQEAIVTSTNALGVIPINPLDCPPVDTVTLYLDDEDSDNESDYSGWDVPTAARRARKHNTRRVGTTFTFCKVDGSAFKSLTKFDSKPEYFYSALKLGTTCPNGSQEVERHVDGEHDDNASYIRGPAGKNHISVSAAHLFFCVFGPNTSKMSYFPDLDMAYAVFHDYDGPQPDHFVGKRWFYSDDEDYHNLNHTIPMSGVLFDRLEPMIGGGNNTMWDMGRVY